MCSRRFSWMMVTIVYVRIYIILELLRLSELIKTRCTFYVLVPITMMVWQAASLRFCKYFDSSTKKELQKNVEKFKMRAFWISFHLSRTATDIKSNTFTHTYTHSYLWRDFFSISWWMRDNPAWNVSNILRVVVLSSHWFWWHCLAVAKRLLAIVS